MASDRLPSRPSCLIVASAATRDFSVNGADDLWKPSYVPYTRSAPLSVFRQPSEQEWSLSGLCRFSSPLISLAQSGYLSGGLSGQFSVSAHSFLHCFTMGSAAFNLQVATPGGKAIDFVGVNESSMRWIQDFRMKAYASPAKLESIDGARYHALLIPSCPGALTDLANSGYLARILEHFSTEQKPICAVGHGVAALCCATKEDKSWVFQDYSITGPSVYELILQPGFGSLPIIVEDFVKDAGASFSASQPDAVHVVLDRHLVTGQNDASTVLAVQNLVFLCGSRPLGLSGIFVRLRGAKSS
ncbi:glutamine amidotransferase-like class 1 domain-containing protein 1 isoform X2 [Petaurus breviceps papuanus]|uniref:glutamine amidotransferase-like class 1 domain-containing protein 1 isoform X2 n=1 Tax=Petaurus breviceps papuanus TaxID=3040969 RepID=UPI0036DCAFAB